MVASRKEQACDGMRSLVVILCLVLLSILELSAPTDRMYLRWPISCASRSPSNRFLIKMTFFVLLFLDIPSLPSSACSRRCSVLTSSFLILEKNQ